MVLPCRNQADHIGRILSQYLEAMASLALSFELVVVPNASRDGTAEIVGELARRNPAVRMVVNPLGGWGRSVRTGLDAARGDVLAYTNSARTDPGILPVFISKCLESEGSLVKARREARRAPLRTAGSTLYNLEARVCFGLSTTDVNGTPKVFGRSLYESTRLTADGDLLDLELLVRARRLGVPLVEIPVRGFSRHGGRSSTNITSALKMYTGALRLWLTGAA